MGPAAMIEYSAVAGEATGSPAVTAPIGSPVDPALIPSMEVPETTCVALRQVWIASPAAVLSSCGDWQGSAASTPSGPSVYDPTGRYLATSTRPSVVGL